MGSIPTGPPQNQAGNDSPGTVIRSTQLSGRMIGRMTDPHDLAALLDLHETLIRDHLAFGAARWDGILDRLGNGQEPATYGLLDEQLWTFLLAAGYAAAGPDGVNAWQT